MKLAKLALATAFALATASAFAADKPFDKQNRDGKISKSEAANASRSDDSGFAKLDKNKDGYISKAEAAGEAELAKNFAKWDMNNDGRINRGEYLAAMAKVDATKVKDKVADKIDDAKDKRQNRDAATGATTDKKR
ncbi:MAG: hypothetical protein ACT4P4_30005 [Betaproteobacteria bacterium]